LSANGIARLNTRESWIGVLPTRGASRHTAAVTAPKPATVTANRPLMSLRACKGHHR
jgi:hypothetical protein